MARHEFDREDLIAEATALVERAEIITSVPPGETATTVVGFRRDGALSCYFGGEPVYQFNARHQLRRAFIDGRLLKADAGRLVSLRRVRAEGKVSLLSTTLSELDSLELLHAMSDRLRRMADALANGTAQLARQIPADADLSQRITTALRLAAATAEIASRPNL